MPLPLFASASRSLHVRFLAALLIGAVFVTTVGSYVTYQVAQTHIQEQLLARSRLLASAINHSAMVAKSRMGMQHVVEEVLRDNSDILEIGIRLRDENQMFASATAERASHPVKGDPHLREELQNAVEHGVFGFHVETNQELVLVAPLWHPLDDESGHMPGARQGAGPAGTEHSEASEPAYNDGQMSLHGDTEPGPRGTRHGADNHRTAKDDWVSQSLNAEDYRGAILLQMDRSAVASTMSNILWGLMPTSSAAVIAVLALAYLVLHFQVISPIGRIRHIMKKQQSGDRKARVKSQQTSEFDEVAVAFNAMIDAIAEREETIEKLALTDGLTGLGNRNMFNRSLQSSIANAREENERIALLFLDLDKFKNVNDTLGHMVGDLLLNEVSERIVACMHENDLVARLGGDEFAIILTERASVNDVDTICRNITATLSEPIPVDGVEVCIGVSIGISFFPDQAEDELALIRNADLALYQVKERHRGGYRVYDHAIQKAAAEADVIEQELRLAIARKEFSLRYQPQISIDGSGLVGVEALIRWNHPERGIISPDEFIPIAENTGLIISIGEWVLRTACSEAKAWHDAGLPPFPVAVNISARQLTDPDFVGLVRQTLEETGLEPQLLELEVTETLVMEQTEDMSDILNALNDLGISLAIDDFGTGHSSLSRLRSFPVSKLKIDQTFVTDISSGNNDAAITQAIIQLARNMRMTVIAEGVENQRQLDFLTDNGCDQVQGYFFAKPLSNAAFLDWYAHSHVPEFAIENLNSILGRCDFEPGVQAMAQRKVGPS